MLRRSYTSGIIIDENLYINHIFPQIRNIPVNLMNHIHICHDSSGTHFQRPTGCVKRKKHNRSKQNSKHLRKFDYFLHKLQGLLPEYVPWGYTSTWKKRRTRWWSQRSWTLTDVARGQDITALAEHEWTRNTSTPNTFNAVRVVTAMRGHIMSNSKYQICYIEIFIEYWVFFMRYSLVKNSNINVPLHREIVPISDAQGHWTVRLTTWN